MKLSRSFAGTGVSVMALALAGGCQAYPTLKNLPVDCSADSRYDFEVIDTFENVGMTSSFFSSGDPFCTALMTVGAPEEAIEGGGRCGSQASLVLRAAHCNDWGSLYGYNNFGPRDASAYEGFSFWARAPGNTAKEFTIVLNDENTAVTTTAIMTNCIDYGDAGVTAMPQGGGTDQGTGAVITSVVGAAPKPDACGNEYTTLVVVTTGWRFYTVPFSDFHQTANPNRVPNQIFDGGTVPGTGLLSSGLASLVIRVPKESASELWIDDLSFYRHKGWRGTGDGGVVSDAAPN